MDAPGGDQHRANRGGQQHVAAVLRPQGVDGEDDDVGGDAGHVETMVVTADPVEVQHAAAPPPGSRQEAGRRLMRELQRLQKDTPHGIAAKPIDGNLFKWRALICGPEDTPWEGGAFKLIMEFTADYPMVPPAVQFRTKVFHPNIYENGNICMDVLKTRWSPTYEISTLLLSIMSLLADPNPMSAANAEAAKLLTENQERYDEVVRNLVMESLEQSITDDDDS